jgi:Zn-dependent protease with chaperone function
MGGFTQSALLKALGWSLFDSLWQMALLWIVYLLLVSAFSKMSAHSRHGLAFSLISLGTGSFLLAFLIHYYRFAGGETTGTWLSGLLLAAQHAGYALPEAMGRSIDRLLPYFSSLYLLALIFQFTRYSNHYLYARRLKAEGLSRVGPALRVFVAQTAGRMGIKKEVGVWLSSGVDVPMTLGFLRPVILIPFAMVNNLSLEQVEAILLHELAHIKRFDYLLNLGVTVMQLVFFFNPFARLLIQQVRKEREHRCDDLVIQFRYDPHAYASALLSLARQGRYNQAMAMAATGKNDRLLLQRVRRILQQDRRVDRPGARPLLFFLFTLVAALFTLSHRVDPEPAMIVNSAFFVNRPSAEWPSREPFVATAHLKNVLALNDNGEFQKPPDPEENRLVRPPAQGDRASASHDRLSDNRVAEDRRLNDRLHNDQKPGDQLSDDQLSDDQLSDDKQQDGQLTDEDISVVSNPFPASIDIHTLHIDPVRDTTLSARLLAALTDAESSASEVKIRIQKAIVINGATISKTQTALAYDLKAMRGRPTKPPALQQHDQKIKKQALEERIEIQRRSLLMQQDLQKRLETAVKKLKIVYI